MNGYGTVSATSCAHSPNVVKDLTGFPTPTTTQGAGSCAQVAVGTAWYSGEWAGGRGSG